MLKEIICDKLSQQHLVFSKGLNVIVGDESAANSIGKSSALLLIDFALGGDSYYTKRPDIVENIGPHDVFSHFVFCGQDYYFRRSTDNPAVVFCCNEEYRVEKEITNSDFTKLLQVLYRIPDCKLSFRQIVGQFSRIYGVGNCDEKNPLFPGYYQNGETSVLFLIKLFNLYARVEASITAKTDSKKRLDTYKDAVRLKLVPSLSNKKEYEENEKKIGELNEEIDLIKKRVVLNAMDLTSEQLYAISILKSKLARVQEKKALATSMIERLDYNVQIASDSEFSNNIEEIKRFFPKVDTKELNEVNTFHRVLSSILKDEIKNRKEKEESNLRRLKEEETDIVNRITKIAEETHPEELTINRLMDTKNLVDSLISGRQSYETNVKLKEEASTTEKAYSETITKILETIQLMLNDKMKELNSHVQREKKAPEITLYPKKYSVRCDKDTGTGTSYRALILFDLAILNLTTLPLLIHDSLLFKNIEDDAIDGIIKQYYNEEQKQIIISLDKISSYSNDVLRIVDERKIITLSRETPLYGKTWNK